HFSPPPGPDGFTTPAGPTGAPVPGLLRRGRLDHVGFVGLGLVGFVLVLVAFVVVLVVLVLVLGVAFGLGALVVLVVLLVLRGLAFGLGALVVLLGLLLAFLAFLVLVGFFLVAFVLGCAGVRLLLVLAVALLRRPV